MGHSLVWGSFEVELGRRAGAGTGLPKQVLAQTLSDAAAGTGKADIDQSAATVEEKHAGRGRRLVDVARNERGMRARRRLHASIVRRGALTPP
jgi:hypothetical protein